MTVNIAFFNDLDAVAEDAAGALNREARASLFERLDWFRLIATHCPPPGDLLVVRAGDAWLFLTVQGKRATAFSAWYSLRVGIAGDRNSDVMTAIARALRERGLASVTLAPVEDPEPLAAAFRAAGWLVELQPRTGNWRIDTTGMSFEDYWASRPGKLRSTYKRRAKAAGLEIEIHDRFDADAWAAYEAVYRASWKPEEGSFPFLRALAEQEGAAGALRLGIARKDGAPIAAQLWLVENGEATIHKLAYAESAKELSPGTILGHAMFQRAIDTDRVRAIDYGTGDEPYKADWMAERRQLWTLTARNPRTLRGLAGALRAKAASLARRGTKAIGAARFFGEAFMHESSDAQEVDATLRAVLIDVLGLPAARVARFDESTALFGALPEFDSMAVAGLLTELEERLGIVIEDHEVDADMLESYGALLNFARTKALT